MPSGSVALVGLTLAALVAFVAIGHRWYRELHRKLLLVERSLREAHGASLLAGTRDLPWTPHAASPWLIHYSRESIARVDHPPLVVECGSGISTILLGESVATRGGRLIALEENQEWARVVRGLVARNDLAHCVTVIHYPVETVSLLGVSTRWYAGFDPREHGVAIIDVLVVDGPIGASGHLARLGALPALRQYLSGTSVIVLDDADRPDEKTILELWKKHYGVTAELIGIGRAFARLRLPETMES